ncbi:MAG: RluA family pseudouridine synthase [Clostridia bacterium]|nr:RluA family pseudouridine synthase [Clostridia bacterium]
MKSFEIDSNSANQRLDKFITKNLPNLPQSLMYKYIRTKKIKVNRKRAEISTRLAVGDIVDMYINDEFFEKPDPHYDFLHASLDLHILYEDENIIILDKKVGLLSHPDDNEYVDTLISRVKHYLYNKGEYDPESPTVFTPALINRIDRNTGGIVMAAKNAETLRIMNQKVKDRELHKFYICVTHGIPPKTEDLLVDYLIKDESKNQVKVFDRQVPGSKEIKTYYKVLKTDKVLAQRSGKRNISLLEVELLTGRTHQIRAHMAFLGCPLVGDGKYGSNALNKELGYKKQFLYSYKLIFDFTTDAGILSYLNGKEFSVPMDDIWFAREFPNF